MTQPAASASTIQGPTSSRLLQSVGPDFPIRAPPPPSQRQHSRGPISTPISDLTNPERRRGRSYASIASRSDNRCSSTLPWIAFPPHRPWLCVVSEQSRRMLNTSCSKAHIRAPASSTVIRDSPTCVTCPPSFSQKHVPNSTSCKASHTRLVFSASYLTSAEPFWSSKGPGFCCAGKLSRRKSASVTAECRCQSAPTSMCKAETRQGNPIITSSRLQFLTVECGRNLPDFRLTRGPTSRCESQEGKCAPASPCGYPNSTDSKNTLVVLSCAYYFVRNNISSCLDMFGTVSSGRVPESCAHIH